MSQYSGAAVDAIDEAEKLLRTRLHEIEDEATRLRAAIRALNSTRSAGTEVTRVRAHSSYAPSTVARSRNETPRDALAFAHDAIAETIRSTAGARAATNSILERNRGGRDTVGPASRVDDATPCSAEIERSAISVAPSPPERAAKRMSMRERVLSVLEGNPDYMTPAEIGAAIEQQGHRDPRKTDAEIGNAVRTALWQLRTKGLVTAGHTDGLNIATKWLDQTAMSTNSEIESDHAASVEPEANGEEGG